MLQTVLVREVLVSLPSGAGVVRLQNGSVVVTEDVDEGSGACVREDDRFRPVKVSVGGDRCVVGGLLPPGAVRAEVVDDRGVRVSAAVAEGAYVAVLGQPEDGSNPIVCCRDVAGEVVRRPRAADYPSVRVTDAQGACPACGARTSMSINRLKIGAVERYVRTGPPSQLRSSAAGCAVMRKRV